MLLVVALSLHLLAAGLAVLLALRDRGHTPVAIFFAGTLGADLCRLALVALVLQPLRPAGGAPFAGWGALACHLDAALWLLWPAGLAAMALAIVPVRRGWSAAAGAWFACSGAVAAAYPLTRGPVLGTVYRAAEGVGVAVALASLVAGRPRGLPALVVALVVAGEIAGVVAGAWAADPFERWELTQIQLVALFGVVAAVEGGAWCAR